MCEQYVVQCMNGHVGYAREGSELEKKCIARIDQGYLDALCLGPTECPECVEEDEAMERKYRQDCALYGDPFESPW